MLLYVFTQPCNNMLRYTAFPDHSKGVYVAK